MRLATRDNTTCTIKFQVAEVHTDRVERTLKGSKIVRNGTEEAPAYLIVQDDGDKVLKLHTELDAD